VADTGTADLPRVAVVIPNYNGAGFLSACLDSVAAQDYPRDRVETIVVDNGSTDATFDVLARYPWARVVRNDENLGFAAAVNAGAQASDAECLALANNDMRLDPAWVRQLVAAYAPAEGFLCVAGVILDSSGERVDFAGGYVTFHGMAGQLGFGQPLEEVSIVDGRELLFACGGSMLVDRSLFLELGGFDPAYFAYFEDVDFGWRLALAGHKVRLAAGAKAFHHHHGTSSSFQLHQRMVLYERNALYTLFKNLDERNAYRLLAAALCLMCERAFLDSGVASEVFAVGDPTPAFDQPVPLHSLALLQAVREFVRTIEETRAKREQVQSLRRLRDDEIFARFGRPFFPLSHNEQYLEASASVLAGFEIRDLFPVRRASRLLFVGPGPGGRSADLARAAAAFVPVVYVTTTADATLAGLETVRARSREELETLVRESDVVVVSAAAPDAAEVVSAARGIRPLVVDVGADTDGATELARKADLVLCASAAQRDRLLADSVAAEVHVVPGDDPADPLRPVRLLVEHPDRFGFDANGPREARTTTEELQVLASVWRAGPRGNQPATRAARSLWRGLPEPARRLARPLLDRLRSRKS